MPHGVHCAALQPPFPGAHRHRTAVWPAGGGFGTLVRAAGLLGSNIISLTAVDGRGRIVRADSDSHADLLWAARGGGGGRYVIVTEFVFRTVDVSSGVTDITALVPADQAVQVLAAYQRWHPSLPNKFTFDAIWTDGAPDGRVTAEIHGTVGRACSAWPCALLSGSNTCAQPACVLPACFAASQPTARPQTPPVPICSAWGASATARRSSRPVCHSLGRWQA